MTPQVGPALNREPTGPVQRADAVAAFDLARRGQLVLSGVDALVLATREQTDEVSELARQVLQSWRTFPEAIVFDQAGCRAGPNLLLRAQDARGPWVYLAAVAGLRSLTALRDCNADDVLSLARELALLSPEPENLARLHAWLWSDGLDGFRSELLPRFGDRTAEPAPISPPAPEIGALVAACDDPVFWLAEDLAAVRAHAELQPLLPAEQLARRLRRAAATALDWRIVAMFRALALSRHAYAVAAVEAIDREPMGEAIASRAPLDSTGLHLVLLLIEGQSAHIASGIVQGLLLRAAVRGDVLDAPIAALAAQIGPARFVEMAGVPNLPQPLRMALGRVLARVPGGPEWIAEQAANWTPSELVGLLQSVPAPLLARIGRQLGPTLVGSHVRERSQLSQMLIATGSMTCLTVLASAMRDTEAQGWELRTIRSIYRALLTNNIEPDLLIKLTFSARSPIEARQVMLQELGGSHLADEALRWRVSELLEPLAFREELARLRQGEVQP